MAQQARTSSRIPEFASREEEAAFWDTHDTTDFEDEWEPVEVEVVKPLRHGLTVSFEGTDFHRLVAFAKACGIGPGALARTWVLDALALAEAAGSDEPDGAAVG